MIGKQKKLGQIVVILALLITSVFSAHGQRSDEYQVYDAVIRHMFAGGITQFDMNAKIDQIVIRKQTFSEYAWGRDKENWEQVKFRLPSLTEETIAGYESVRNRESKLKAKLDIPYKYVFIADKTLESIFGNTRNQNSTEETWKKFYEAYPSSAGYNSFSRVGFDKANRQALVYFVNWCRPLCGTGTYVLLEKGQNGWTVKGAGMMWIS